MNRVPVLIAAALLVVLAATAFPFLPGRYDELASPISTLARIIGVGSLLLVPIGIAWLTFEVVGSTDFRRRMRVGFIGAAIGAMSILVAIAFVGAAAMFALSLGVAVLAIWAIFLWRRGREMHAWARNGSGNYAMVAAAMIAAPTVTAAAIIGMTGPLQQWSQNRIMDAMQHLIDHIEQYRVARGGYPQSLFAEWMDYRPEIIGVRGYQYEPVGDKYSIAVEVPVFDPSARAYLMYNPNDEFRMASHDEWLLTWSDNQLALHRGYAFSREVGRQHWRILFYD